MHASGKYNKSWLSCHNIGLVHTLAHGSFVGITSKLDYIKSLGVDTIWLSPVYVSPMADFGYDIANHKDIDPIFGDLDDLQRLIKSAHDRGMYKAPILKKVMLYR